jgi:hypothetical protein
MKLIMSKYSVFKYPLILLIFGLMVGCGAIKEIPVTTVEKVVVRDSVIYVSDTIEVPVPYEVIKEIVPQDTVSVLKTSVALSEAKIEKGLLSHSLEQKGTIPTRIDTFYVTQIKEVEKMVEVPIEVKIEKKVVPDWCWWNLVYSVILSLLVGFWLYLKFIR